MFFNSHIRTTIERSAESGTLESNDPLEFLPVERQYFPAIPVGNTPLWHPTPEVPVENLLKKYGFPDLYLKDDGANSTGSLKDRASFLVAAFACKHGISEVVVASTGNAGSSMAGVGAAAGLKVKLFLPKTAPPAKMIQALKYRADLVLADKNYDQAFSLSLDSGIDNVLELTHYEKKRIHNLKYFTWIKQQGRELSELNDQWYGHVEYRQNIFALAPQIDELIVEFNRQIDAA